MWLNAGVSDWRTVGDKGGCRRITRTLNGHGAESGLNSVGEGAMEGFNRFSDKETDSTCVRERSKWLQQGLQLGGDQRLGGQKGLPPRFRQAGRSEPEQRTVGQMGGRKEVETR